MNTFFALIIATSAAGTILGWTTSKRMNTKPRGRD